MAIRRLVRFAPSLIATLVFVPVMARLAQAQYVSIMPDGGSYPVGTQLTLHLIACSGNDYFDGPGSLTHNGGPIGNFGGGSSAPGCNDYGETDFPVTLLEGTNQFTATICTDVSGCIGGSIYIRTPPDPPGIDVTPHNGFHHNSALCEVNCFDAVVSYTTPSYWSLDASHAVTLMYSSGQAQGRYMIQADVWNTASLVPDHVLLQLLRSDGSFVTSSDAPGWPSGTRRFAVQFVDTTLTTGAYTYTVEVTAFWGGTAVTSTAQVRLLALNERASPYGAGWTIAGLQRVKPAALGDSVVIWDGTGTIQFWRRTSCDASGCTFTPPLGEFDRLRFTNAANRSDPNVAYTRTTVDKAKLYFDDQGRLRYADDRFGNRTTFQWLDAQRLQYIIDPAGKVISFAYDGNNRLSSIRDSVGHRSTSFTVNSSNDLIQIQDPAGGRPFQQAQYDGSQRLISRVDRRGALWSYSYDFAGKLATDSTPPVLLDDGSTKRLATLYRSPESAVLTSSDSAGIATVTPSGLLRRVMLVDKFGAVVLVVAPSAEFAMITRNDNEQIGTSIDSTGTNTFSWDGPRMLSHYRSKARSTVSLQWDTTWNVVTRQSGGASDVRNYLGSSGRIDSTRVGTDPVTRFTYDARGRIVTATDPRGHVTQYYRDGTSSLNTDSVKTGSKRVAYTYDSFGRVATTKNPANIVDTTGYDVLNRVSRRAGPLGSLVTYAYGDSLNLTAVTDAKGQTYRTDKNLVGWDTSVVDPRGHKSRYTYDIAGFMRHWTNRRGQVTTFVHDALGRDSIRTLSDNRTTTYLYGPTWRVVRNEEGSDSLRWNGDSLFETLVRGSANYTVLSVFDAANKYSSVALWMNGSADQYRVTYGLDTAFRVKTIRTENPTPPCYPPPCIEVHEDTLVYNADGRLTTINRHGVTNTSDLLRPGHDLAAVTYTNSTWQSGFGAQFNQDSLGRTVEKDNGSRTQFERYTYDALGRVTGFRRYPASPPCPLTDTLGEFGQPCTTGGTLVASDTFTYDVVGNRVEGGVVADTGNRVLFLRGDSLLYDLDNDVVRKWKPDGTFDQRLYWNSIGQLDSVWTYNQGSSQTIRFGYDGLGRRVRRTVGTTTTLYLHHGGQLVAEYDSSVGLQRHYTWDPVTGAPHSVLVVHSLRPFFGDRYYFTTDGHGNVAGLVNASGNSITAFYRYKPFGETDSLSESVTNRLRFSGSELDMETGLYHMGARYYDPSLGRFMSEDPLGVGGGINQFAYAANDPLNFRDPTGLACEMSIAPSGGTADQWADVVGTSEDPRLDPLAAPAAGECFENWDEFWDWVEWALDWAGGDFVMWNMGTVIQGTLGVDFDVFSLFGHLSRVAAGIGFGTMVEAGDLIGFSGNTGMSTGPHLHYEVRINGRPVNPIQANWAYGWQDPLYPMPGETSPFGARINPFTGNPENHPGVDLPVPVGTAVYADARGMVIAVGEYARGSGLYGYGIVVVIWHF